MSLEQAITELTTAVKALTAAMEKPLDAVQTFAEAVSTELAAEPITEKPAKPAKPAKPDGVRATPSARPLAADAEPAAAAMRAAEAAAAAEPAAEQAVEPPSEPQAAAPSVETLATALRAAAVRNHQGAVDLLAEFGVRKGADLPEARRAEFITRLEAL